MGAEGLIAAALGNKRPKGAKAQEVVGGEKSDPRRQRLVSAGLDDQKTELRTNELSGFFRKRV